MRIIKEGRKDFERVFRFFCDCGCVWEAKEHEVIVTLDVYDKNKVNAVWGCPYCGRIKKGVEI